MLTFPSGLEIGAGDVWVLLGKVWCLRTSQANKFPSYIFGLAACKSLAFARFGKNAAVHGRDEPAARTKRVRPS